MIFLVCTVKTVTKCKQKSLKRERALMTTQFCIVETVCLANSMWSKENNLMFMDPEHTDSQISTHLY